MDGQKSSSHLRAGLMAGAMLGLAAGLFLQSRKGKQLTKDAQKKAIELQKQVMQRLRNLKEMSQEKYMEIVDQVIKYYVKTKNIAKKEIPEVRKYLMSHWKNIQAQMQG